MDERQALPGDRLPTPAPPDDPRFPKRCARCGPAPKWSDKVLTSGSGQRYALCMRCRGVTWNGREAT